MGRQDAANNKVGSGKVESRKQPQFPIRLNRVIWHPVTLMATALTLSLSVASIATFEMLKVDPSPQAATSSPSPDAATGLRFNHPLRVGRHTDNKDSLPIASLTAVAISCAAGSFLLCRCLWTRKPDRRMTLSSSHKRTAYPARTRSNAVIRANALPKEQLPQSQSQGAPITAATIVPTSEAHPLDWNEPSIADNLDIRQKRPLSHWL